MVLADSTTGSKMLIVITPSVGGGHAWYVPDQLDGWRFCSPIWNAHDVPGGWRWVNDDEAVWTLARLGVGLGLAPGLSKRFA